MTLSKEKAREAVIKTIASLAPRKQRCGAEFPLKPEDTCIRRKGHRGKHLNRAGQLWSKKDKLAAA
jgi:hypothetical protein